MEEGEGHAQMMELSLFDGGALSSVGQLTLGEAPHPRSTKRSTAVCCNRSQAVVLAPVAPATQLCIAGQVSISIAPVGGAAAAVQEVKRLSLPQPFDPNLPLVWLAGNGTGAAAGGEQQQQQQQQQQGHNHHDGENASALPSFQTFVVGSMSPAPTEREEPLTAGRVFCLQAVGAYEGLTLFTRPLRGSNGGSESEELEGAVELVASYPGGEGGGGDPSLEMAWFTAMEQKQEEGNDDDDEEEGEGSGWQQQYQHTCVDEGQEPQPLLAQEGNVGRNGGEEGGNSGHQDTLPLSTKDKREGGGDVCAEVAEVTYIEGASFDGMRSNGTEASADSAARDPRSAKVLEGTAKSAEEEFNLGRRVDMAVSSALAGSVSVKEAERWRESGGLEEAQDGVSQPPEAGEVEQPCTGQTRGGGPSILKEEESSSSGEQAGEGGHATETDLEQAGTDKIEDGGREETMCMFMEGPLGVTLRLDKQDHRVKFGGVQTGGQAMAMGIEDGFELTEANGFSLRQAEAVTEEQWRALIAHIKASGRPLSVYFVPKRDGGVRSSNGSSSEGGLATLPNTIPPCATSTPGRGGQAEATAAAHRGQQEVTAAEPSTMAPSSPAASALMPRDNPSDGAPPQQAPLREACVQLLKPSAMMWAAPSLLGRKLFLYSDRLALLATKAAPASSSFCSSSSSPLAHDGGVAGWLGGLANSLAGVSSTSTGSGDECEKEEWVEEVSLPLLTLRARLLTAKEEGHVHPPGSSSTPRRGHTTGREGEGGGERGQTALELLSPSGKLVVFFVDGAMSRMAFARDLRGCLMSVHSGLATPPPGGAPGGEAEGKLPGVESGEFTPSPGWQHHLLQGTLHSAAVKGDASLAMQLLSSSGGESAGGGNGSRRMVDAEDESGYTPLHLSALAHKHAVLSILCEGGADVERVVSPEVDKSQGGDRPIHLAARGLRSGEGEPLLRTLLALISRGCCINAASAATAAAAAGRETGEGGTALDYLVGVIVAAGGSEGQDDVARQAAAMAAVMVLLEHGARLGSTAEAGLEQLIGKTPIRAAKKKWGGCTLLSVPPQQQHRMGQGHHAGQGGGGESCEACGLVFTLFKRQHHCRVCGRRVCGKCSSKEAPMMSGSGGTSRCRACDGCFNRLSASSSSGGNSSSSSSSSQGKASPVAGGGGGGAKREADGQHAARGDLFGNSSARSNGSSSGGERGGADGGRGVRQIQNQMAEVSERMRERGQKLNTLADKSDEMLSAATSFEDMAKQLNRKQRSWW